jgi:hypothetical protein
VAKATRYRKSSARRGKDHPDVAVRLLRERAELSDAEKLALSLRALFGKEEAAPGGAN